MATTIIRRGKLDAPTLTEIQRAVDEAPPNSLISIDAPRGFNIHDIRPRDIPPKCFIGIDPGVDGAIAMIDQYTGALRIVDIPTIKTMTDGRLVREVDAQGLASVFSRRAVTPVKVYVEHVYAMRRDGRAQGATSMFNFGRGFGVILGVLACVCSKDVVTPVRPATWKKLAHVPRGKDAARARATELMPACGALWARKKDHGRAEAAILAMLALSSVGLHERLKIVPAP